MHILFTREMPHIWWRVRFLFSAFTRQSSQIYTAIFQCVYASRACTWELRMIEKNIYLEKERERDCVKSMLNTLIYGKLEYESTE